jgi:PAS domain S-box-containing protein
VDQQGNYGGLSADYMRAVAQRLGLRLELVPGLSWAQVLDGLKAHRIDLITGVVRTPERERYIAFSQPYFYMPWVIIGRANASVGPDLKSLRGRTVACVRSYFVFERLVTDYPEVRLLTTASEAESLDAVARGHADAAISQLAVATPLLTQNYLGRLRVIALVDEFKEGLRFGVRSDWPELAALLNKGLASMTEAEQEPIRQRWLTIRIERGTDWWAVAKVAVPVGAGLLIIVAIVLVANRRLQRAKREVSDQLAFVSAMIDTYPSPVFYKDRHGRYLGCNPAYEAAFGQTRGAMRGKTVLDMHYLPPEMRQKLHEDDLRLLAEGGTFHEPLRVKFADGQMHDTLYWKSAFNLADGRVGGMLGVLVDITVQKQQEAALAEARDQAEAATRSKSAFLAAMSHEIRTPMNGILGMLEILGLSRLDDEQTHAVGTIQDSARALLGIIDDILDFSKIEAGRLTLESRPADLCDVLESTAQLFVSNARGNGLELRCFVDARIRRAVLGDSLRLRQVLSNLLSNAIKFTPRGRVTLAAELIEAMGEMIRVRIQVTDTGIGVSEENQKGLFQPFVQAESSTSRRFGGTGLGLTICMRLVEMMHGRIEMRSREGEGTSMIVTLPFELDREPLPEARGERLQGLRLLLVTDDPEEARFYPDYFRFWDCDVRMTQVDQAGAVAAEDSAAFDVIICGASALDAVRAAFSHPSARSNVLTQPA